jgi:hypothetical protein
MPVPELHVRLAGPYPTADFDRLLGDLAPLDAVTSQTLVIVDLQRLGRIGGPAAAVLAATLLDVTARGVLSDGSRILAPHDHEVRRRLEELDVLGLLVGAPAAADRGRHLGRGVRPCQLFTGADEPGLVAQSLTSAMAEVCQTDGGARSAMWFALNEIAQNVSDHAHARGGAVAIAEVTREGSELEVAIADHGIGVRASLARNPSHHIASDLDALRIAVTPGLTGDPERPGAGLGLYLTRLLLRDNRGALIMRSGTAQLEAGEAFTESLALAPMRGTLVRLRFRTDQPVSLDSLLGAT